jgi:hypothetical protein
MIDLFEVDDGEMKEIMDMTTSDESSFLFMCKVRRIVFYCLSMKGWVGWR